LITDGLAARFGVKMLYEPKIQGFHGSVEGLEMPGSPNNKRLKISFAKTSTYRHPLTHHKQFKPKLIY
jgi:hypothetical protein